jgi:NAD(P)-dependent dehydrogenase (short-subunit alcohol dehydrogenase family)
MSTPQSDQPVAVITGGASGIGLAFARAYAQRGLRVVIADIDEDAWVEASMILSHQGAVVDCIAVDLRDPTSVTQLGETAASIGRLSAVLPEHRRHGHGDTDLGNPAGLRVCDGSCPSAPTSRDSRSRLRECRWKVGERCGMSRCRVG